MRLVWPLIVLAALNEDKHAVIVLDPLKRDAFARMELELVEGSQCRGRQWRLNLSV